MSSNINLLQVHSTRAISFFETRMSSGTPQQTSAMNFTTVAPPLKDEVEEGVTWIHGLLLMILLIFLGICIIIIAALSLRRYKKREKVSPDSLNSASESHQFFFALNVFIPF